MKNFNRSVAFFILYLLVALVFTYPLLLEMDSRVPVDTGDPLYNTWVVNWNIHALTTNPLSLFDANIFYPYKNTLAFSDIFLAPSLLVLPILLITGNPLAAYNALIIFFYVFSAWAMFLLVRYLTKNNYISFLIGVAYGYSSYRYAHMGHLQLLSDGFFIIVILFAHRYLDSQRFKYLMWATVFLLIQTSSSWYYGIYSFLFLISFLAFFLAAGRLDIKPLTKHLLPALALMALVLAFFAWPYLRFYKTLPRFKRTIVDAHYFAARPWSYFTVLPSNLFFGKLLNPLYGRTMGIWEKVLFPGLTASIFAVWSSVSIIFTKTRLRDKQSQIILFYLMTALIGIILSFGPYVFVGPRQVWLPYKYLYDWLPGFSSMRVPARFGLLVTAALSVLAALGLRDVYERLKGRLKGPYNTYILVFGSLALLVVTAGSQLSWPIKLSEEVRSGIKIPKIYRFLAKQDSRGALIEMPAIKFGRAGEVLQDTWVKETYYMYYSIFHWQRLVNGYSGFDPPVYKAIMKEMQNFPSKRSLALLRGFGIDKVLIHSQKMRQTDWTVQKKALARTSGVTLKKEMDGDFLYRISAGKRETQKGSLKIETIKGPSSAPPATVINLGVKVVNTAPYPVTVSPDNQPLTELIWENPGIRETDKSQLPVLLGAGESTWLPVQVRTPGANGKFKLKAFFRSPLIKNAKRSLWIKTDQSASVSTDPKAKLGVRYLNIRSAPREVMAGGDFKLKMRLINTGKALWISRYTSQMETKEPINLGEVHTIATWRLIGQQSRLGKLPSEVTFFPYDLGSGDEITLTIPLQAPELPGDYKLNIDMIALGIAHFSDQGSPVINVPVKVRAK